MARNRHFGSGYSHFGEDTKGHDLKVYGDTTNKYIFWDASANTLYIEGTLDCDTELVESFSFDDAEDLKFGAGEDVKMQWDGTNFIIAAAADDSLIEIGDSAATQKSFDLKWYGDSANGADYLYFDASANLIYTTGVDLQLKDNDVLAFGTGAGAAGDVNIKWDGTNLIVTAAADDSLIEIGDAAAAQKSFDIKWYGNEANGASYLLADASGNLISTVGVAMTLGGKLTVGADDTGHDVQFFGATAGCSMLWDESEDQLVITGSADVPALKIAGAGSVSAAAYAASGVAWADGATPALVADQKYLKVNVAGTVYRIPLWADA